MRHWLTLLAMPLAACSDNNPGTSVLVRDSAGIHIVENTAPQWTSGAEWRLSAEPLVEIGGETGDPDYDLFRVRGLMRLVDGTIVVANAGSQELRMYGPDGRHIRSVGRMGDGPGEFQDIFHAVSCGADSIVVFDRQALRISVFDGALRFLHSFSSPLLIEGGWAPLSVSCQSDGTMAVVGRGAPPGPRAAEPSGPSRSRVPVFIGSPHVDDFRQVGVFDGPESYLWRDATSGYLGARPFGKVTSIAVANDHLYVATGDAYEIAAHTLDGGLSRLIRKRHTPVPVTLRDVERFKEEMLDTLSQPRWRRLVEPLIDRAEHPEAMAAYGRMVVDETGHLWVEEYVRPGDDRRRWTVFTGEGTMLGEVETPFDLDVRQIGREFVLGVRKDDMDVEHVQLYELIKPEQ